VVINNWWKNYDDEQNEGLAQYLSLFNQQEISKCCELRGVDWLACQAITWYAYTVNK
jgi:hypothetical protein